MSNFLEELGQRIANAGYILRNPGYARVRRDGGARDLYRLLRKPWLDSENIGTVLDVGANEGQFIHVAQSLFPRASILAFEPNPDLVSRLQNLVGSSDKSRVFQIACGREMATMPLHLTTFPPSSSLLRPTSLRIPDFPPVESERSIDVRVERLDRIVSEHGPLRKSYLLKIDVQGYELEVLEGASGILPDIAVVLFEANVAPFYDRQANFEELYAFMRRHHFKLADIGEPIRAPRTGDVLYFDAAFLNNNAGSAV